MVGVEFMKQPGVYILKSLKNSRYYVGSTDNVGRRLKEHNSGLVHSTKTTKPFELLAFIPCTDLSEARSSEFRLKRYKRRDIIEKVVTDKIFPWDYRKGP